MLPATVVGFIHRSRWRARVLGHRLRYLASGRRVAGIGIAAFGGHRIAYRLNSVDAEVLGHSFDRDIFFAAVPNLRLAPDDVVLDVGAHIGT